MQFFQFDKDGNMYVFPPGSGCTGVPRFVRPGEDITFKDDGEQVELISDNVGVCDSSSDGAESSQCASSGVRSFKSPLKKEDLESLFYKQFSPDTMKKVGWATRMYLEWRNLRNESSNVKFISCDLDDVTSVTKHSLIFAVTRFLSEIKKLDRQEYPGKTLYDILICIQFHLENKGIGWKLLNDECFADIKFTLDNLMKIRTAQGIGISVKKAQILTETDEDLLWNLE